MKFRFEIEKKVSLFSLKSNESNNVRIHVADPALGIVKYNETEF